MYVSDYWSSTDYFIQTITQPESKYTHEITFCERML